MTDDLLRIINDIQEFAERPPLSSWEPRSSLRNDLGFDSLDLAELTVRIQDLWGVDVFEDGVVDTLAELEERVRSLRNGRAGSDVD